MTFANGIPCGTPLVGGSRIPTLGERVVNRQTAAGLGEGQVHQVDRLLRLAHRYGYRREEVIDLIREMP